MSKMSFLFGLSIFFVSLTPAFSDAAQKADPRCGGYSDGISPSVVPCPSRIFDHGKKSGQAEKSGKGGSDDKIAPRDLFQRTALADQDADNRP